MTIQPQNNNLNYLIDPTFTNVNRLFVLLFTRNNAGDNRNSFPCYYVPNFEIKGFDVLIDGKRFFDNNDHATGNLLDFAYFKENYRIGAIDLSKQTKLKDPLQISFIGRLDEANGATMFFIIEKSEETTFNFSQNFVTII